MKMVIKYTGESHVRAISTLEIAQAFNIVHDEVRVDRRISRTTEVDGKLGLKLIETSEWSEVSRTEEESDVDETTETTPPADDKTETTPEETTGDAPVATDRPKPRNR